MVSIKRELSDYGLTPRKRWGQHFLVDRNILAKVIRTAKLEKGDVVLEIGPGLGEMTFAIARQVKKVIAVEIDRNLLEILREKTAEVSNIVIIEGDALRVDFNKFLEKDIRMKVVANLPYQISTSLLFRFIESRDCFSSLTLMLQREVAERMIAPPGGKDYGPLSIFTQSVSDLSIPFYIKPSAFFPPPKVESAVVHLVWKKRPLLSPEEGQWFKKVVRGCFGYRRKRLVNALRHSDISLPGDIEQRIKKIGIEPERRPETLSIEEFVRLAEALRP
ncbi:MAG: 16S rRNA (adenine(1518)-N(6)/adenine(1519)-N(6))-dimethyltransferase RsmA [Thermodesulfobacteriota bacterium]